MYGCVYFCVCLFSVRFRFKRFVFVLFRACFVGVCVSFSYLFLLVVTYLFIVHASELASLLASQPRGATRRGREADPEGSKKGPPWISLCSQTVL